MQASKEASALSRARATHTHHTHTHLPRPQAFLSRLGNGETGGETALGGARYMVADGLHPNNWGHKLMADAAVWMVQQAALGLLLRPAGAEERAYLDRKALPEPMHKGARAAHARAPAAAAPRGARPRGAPGPARQRAPCCRRA